MENGKITLVIGGTRSGKSSFAEKLAFSKGSKVGYLATALAGDSEMEKRIEIHRLRRPVDWITREETQDLVAAIEELKRKCDVILLDCLTIWISNLLTINNDTETEISWEDRADHIVEQINGLVKYCLSTKVSLIIVGCEVGLGVVPDNRLARIFRDLNGLANQNIASIAHEVFLVTAGLPIEIKSRAIII